MKNDPILEELYEIREGLAARNDDDLTSIVEEIRRNEERSGRQYVRELSAPAPTETRAASIAQNIEALTRRVEALERQLANRQDLATNRAV